MLTDQYIRRFPSRLYKFLLEDHKLTLIKMKSYSGFINYDIDGSAEIKIDYRDDFVPTLIHEVLHYLHPDWSEDQVERAERILINKLTKRQIKNIIKRIADAL